MTFMPGIAIHRRRDALRRMSVHSLALIKNRRTPKSRHSSSHPTAPIRAILSPPQPGTCHHASPCLLARAAAIPPPLPTAPTPANMPSPRRLAPPPARLGGGLSQAVPHHGSGRRLPAWTIAIGGVVLALILVCMSCVLFRFPWLCGAEFAALREAASRDTRVLAGQMAEWQIIGAATSCSARSPWQRLACRKMRCPTSGSGRASRPRAGRAERLLHVQPWLLPGLPGTRQMPFQD